MIILIDVIGIVFGIVLSYRILEKRYKKKYKEIMRLSDKHLEMFLVMDRWFQNELSGKKIATYLKENNFYNITIYGMGYIGMSLFDYLTKEGFEINNLIDQKKNKSVNGIRIRTINEEYVSTDVIIVTAIYYFEELEDKLKEKFREPILSFADIVYKI